MVSRIFAISGYFLRYLRFFEPYLNEKSSKSGVDGKFGSSKICTSSFLFLFKKYEFKHLSQSNVTSERALSKISGNLKCKFAYQRSNSNVPLYQISRFVGLDQLMSLFCTVSSKIYHIFLNSYRKFNETSKRKNLFKIRFLNRRLTLAKTAAKLHD